MDGTQQQPDGTQQGKKSPGTGGNMDDELFMKEAHSAAKKSEDPNTKVGACIVSKENEIISTGYNKMPNGTEGLPWKRFERIPLDNKDLYVCHAELNAIMNSNRADLSGCTIYATLFPCNECTKIIIQAGIKQVVYLSDKYCDRVKTEASRRMFKDAKVTCSEYEQNTSPSPGGGNPEKLPKVFMDEARSAETKCEDPNTKVGACIVSKENEILSTGYNKMPNGTEEQLGELAKRDLLDNKHLYGITEVVYDSDKYHDRDETKASRRMFDLAKVKCRKKRKRSPGTGGDKEDKFFMATACLAAKQSEDPNTKVGACIVSQENKIVGIGFNGMPNGTEGLPWDRDKKNELDNEDLYVCHAELNAIMNTNMTDLSGCTIYVTLFPCNECTKIILQAGIKKVVYLSDKYHDTDKTVASRRMFESAGVAPRQYPPPKDAESAESLIDFSSFYGPGELETEG